MAAEGWRLKFMEKVLQRHVLVADRETLMITFERPVPAEQREERAARCLDDVIAAEDGARRVGGRAAAGFVGLVAGGAALSTLLGGSEDA
jgi:hypothetical protein